MLERILEYERGLFFFLNGSSFPFLDRFMWLYSGRVVWLPLAALIIFTLVYKKPWREYLMILVAIALIVTLCDQFSSHVCKPLFARLRPTHHPDFMNEVKTVFDYRGGRYGFISSHAANGFGFAVFMSLLFASRFFTFTILSWATLAAISRVYLGVHFISDVVAGAVFGIFLGCLIYFLYIRVRKKYLKSENPPSSLYSAKEKQIISLGVIVTVLAVLLLNYPLTAALL